MHGWLYAWMDARMVDGWMAWMDGCMHVSYVSVYRWMDGCSMDGCVYIALVGIIGVRIANQCSMYTDVCVCVGG